jgi:cyclopropane fatty-acyl-phospholipid synthase-like methyltransferase
MNKPYAESCDRNRDPILSVIRPLLREHKAVLEIGSGTGQHAVFFAEHMPWLTWIASDRQEHHDGIRQWLAEAGLPNTRGPLLLDVTQAEWSTPDVDAVFCANVAHIMHWGEVISLFDGVGKLLPAGGRLMLYGPFNYRGEYSSDSNARFDEWLKARDPESGIRDFEAVNLLAEKAGLVLEQDHAMPANNRILCWRKPKQG